MHVGNLVKALKQWPGLQRIIRDWFHGVNVWSLHSNKKYIYIIQIYFMY